MTYGYIKQLRELVGHTPVILNCTAGILLNQRREVLLNLRTDTHNWSLPGGYLEYGETYAACLHREYKEDSGLDVAIVRELHLFDRGETRYPNGDVAQTIAMLYLVRPTGGALLTTATEETLGLKYWPFDALPPLLNQQNADMLAYAAAHL
ncbi:MAG: NUDIX domain-containing protein [Lactobacillus sp.]|jgi:ADP-ribose pyrophosphatase YjhB (NUDIX family)|nr:NUDIX domain-containing protein [Lactobacillus sp.]MCI2033918.1 NUDIX domain-containing protein [Lactobacillus sp.]